MTAHKRVVTVHRRLTIEQAEAQARRLRAAAELVRDSTRRALARSVEGWEVDAADGRAPSANNRAIL